MTRVWLLSVCALLIAASAGRAGDPRVQLQNVGTFEGDVAAEVQFHDAFDGDLESSIRSGLPITIRFTKELWRDRRRWFDKLVDSRVATYRVRYSARDARFELIELSRFRHREVFDTLDELEAYLSDTIVDISPRWDLSEKHRYYVAIEVALKPMTLEDFRELDDWVRGKLPGSDSSEDTGDGDESNSRGVAGAAFDVLVDLAGFGDRILRDQSPRFRVLELPELSSSR